ncbi:hypothetical protein CLV70_13633 [Pseudosporangium ferrugineum]|uniref:Uncharacterized protein n=1 Tax=Pseudosporangium ferrugineum TaxID=439699 RepID=A0A2T0RDT7_9ACTN|nr:hypothetical protein CLV70_13633 [Pseudosporangium ferrugineum]
MSVHFSETVVREQAKKAAAKKTRKYVALGAVAAVAVIPTAAYAIISGLTGSGTVEGEAYATQNLTVTAGAAAPKLFPGAEANVTFRVNNPNPFPVLLQKVEATNFAPKDGCSITWFTTTLPVNGTSYAFPGYPEADLTVPKQGYKDVTIPNGIKLDTDATKGCGFTLSITVTGAQKAA